MAKTKIKFDDYVDMVRSRAHYYSKCFHMDYEDVEAEGFYIYCISLGAYKKNKASFSTFLYRNLSGYLLAYCKEKTRKSYLDCGLSDVVCGKKYESDLSGDFDFDIFFARVCEPTVEQLLAYAEYYLTPVSFKIFKWILNEQFPDFRQKSNPFAVDLRKLTIKSLSKVLSMNCETVERAWQELFDFWNLRGAAFYSSN